MNGVNAQVRWTAALLAVSTFGLLLGAAARPQFESYGAPERFTGKPAAVDLKSDPEARRFRTRLLEGAAAGPNFAGTYTVVTWGCGTDCQVMAIVDAKTGKVFFPGVSAELGFEYRLDSRLLVANATDEVSEVLEEGGCDNPAVAGWATRSRFYEWNGERLKHISDINGCDN